MAAPTQVLARIPELLRTLPDVIRQPSSNPTVAALLLGMVLLLLLLLALAGALFWLRPRRPRDPETPSGPRRRHPLCWWVTVASISVLLLSGLYAVTAASTASDAVCLSCHAQDNPHSPAPDPHAALGCVSCHEAGGALAGFPARLQHVLAAGRDGYGTPVASSACADCHQTALGSGVGHDTETGVSISHKEPLAAGAECVDCHVLAGGSLTGKTVGMAPCLRCHDGKQAPATCSTCHTGDPSRAIRATVPLDGSLARRLVPAISCVACHTNQRKCDSCHGLRLPHSASFQESGHALAAAKDLWDNGGATCGKCHTPQKNSCQTAGCHASVFPQHGVAWRTQHASASWSQAAAACSCHYYDSNRGTGWDPGQHGGLPFCAACHATKPPGTRP